jgi:hypothetical protein
MYKLGLGGRLRLQIHSAAEAQLKVLVQGLATKGHTLQEHVYVHQAKGFSVHGKTLLGRLDLHLVTGGHVSQPQSNVFATPSAWICKIINFIIKKVMTQF